MTQTAGKSSLRGLPPCQPLLQWFETAAFEWFVTPARSSFALIAQPVEGWLVRAAFLNRLGEKREADC
jgi:hypothetical protein